MTHVGITYVRKANMWCFYICKNKKHDTNILEWFQTKEEAQSRLDKELNGLE